MAMTTKSTLQRAAAGVAARERPYVVTLEPRAGTPASGRPPVRIFLGTQDEQWRAERIFFYAIERVRDPARVYEIHVMKNLAGYARKGWRTGFTNYRFAIPDYAGRSGKAIYNDVDQIYTADPALLFDLDLGEHGYLAVSASDTSVMLLDCARMAALWNLRHGDARDQGAAARQGHGAARSVGAAGSCLERPRHGVRGGAVDAPALYGDAHPALASLSEGLCLSASSTGRRVVPPRARRRCRRLSDLHAGAAERAVSAGRRAVSAIAGRRWRATRVAGGRRQAGGRVGCSDRLTIRSADAEQQCAGRPNRVPSPLVGEGQGEGSGAGRRR